MANEALHLIVLDVCSVEAVQLNVDGPDAAPVAPSRLLIVSFVGFAIVMIRNRCDSSLVFLCVLLEALDGRGTALMVAVVIHDDTFAFFLVFILTMDV